MSTRAQCCGYFFLLAGLVLSGCPEAPGGYTRQVYVDAGAGSDSSGDGTAEDPWRTISVALASIYPPRFPVAPDLPYIHGGKIVFAGKPNGDDSDVGMYVQGNYWLGTEFHAPAASNVILLGVARGEGTTDPPAAPASVAAQPAVPARAPSGFRGMYFNPDFGNAPNYPWLLLYPRHRGEVQTQLKELVEETRANLVAVYVLIAYSLKTPSHAPEAGQPLAAWANLSYLDQVALFVDDCHDAGLSVELDLASNLWVPYSVDPKNQISNSGNWPRPDETPWDEAATWYTEVIEYIEGKVSHPENIALWAMTGNHHWGAAEPCLWPDDHNPAMVASAERLVKEVWPRFKASGTRPKAAPYVFPIFSNSTYWMEKSPEERLSGFTNLKKWIVDDLALPPDYWLMSTYPMCDPAPDGIYYLRRIVDILGRDQASHILSTDFKSIGIDFSDSIISTEEETPSALLAWHLRKCAEYGFAGWWIWSYQDSATEKTGIRDLGGAWKPAMVEVIQNSGN